MRKAITLILYLGMIAGGSWATYEWLVLRHSDYDSLEVAG
jgi:hypothetical protein